MEIVTELTNNQLFLYLPVALVIVGVIIVFTFGFKSAEQPPFNKLTEDRKPAGKKRKIKEKKTVNGVISSGEAKNEKSPTKEKRSPAKESPEVPKQKKADNNKQAEKNKKNEAIKNKSIEEVKNKKNLKKILAEKPVDYDEGNWETVPTKADKKKKQEQSPAKKEKKIKKTDKIDELKIEKGEIDKMVKEVVNKELREKEKEVKAKIVEEEIPQVEELVNEEPVPVVEEKKEKKKEKKAKKEVLIEKPQEIKEPDLPKEVPEVAEVSQPEVENEPSKHSTVNEGGVAFDELGDVWTEAKAAKKSKKKARRDN